MNTTSVEIGDYRPNMKGGALKAHFSFVLHPLGIQFRECCYFEKEGRPWVSLPQKKVEKPGQAKVEYYPIIKILNPEFKLQLEALILKALETPPPPVQYGQRQNNYGSQAPKAKASFFEGQGRGCSPMPPTQDPHDAPPVWF